MRDAALYLLQRVAINRARRTLRQLRSPRYAVALLLGLAYLVLVLFGQQHRTGGPFPAKAVERGGTVLFLFLVAKWWLFGADRSALAFSPAEVQFLFPAPISRAVLLGYKLARTQILILLNVLIWMLLVRGGGPAGTGPAGQAVNLWLLFSIISLHRLGVALTRQTAAEHGRAGLTRAALPLSLVAVGAAAVWITIVRLPPGTFDNPLTGLDRATTTPPLAWLLWPFHLPLLPFAATTMGEWLRSAAVAAGILGLHAIWVLRADRAFEDAALTASAHRAEMVRRLRGTGHQVSAAGAAPRRWFRLGRTGHPAGAIIWKNLTRLARATSPGLLAMAVVGGAFALALGLARREESPLILTMVGTLALSWCGILALLGPLWVRADLRGDLPSLSLLKTWPLPGLQVMTGQVLSSALVLTGYQTILGAVGVVALRGVQDTIVPASLIAAAIPVALAALLGINVLAVGIQNGAALLYPSWVNSEIRPGGIEALGQQVLTTGVSLLLLALLLAGPTILAGGALYLSAGSLGSWAAVPALLLAVLGMAIEAWLLLDWLGDRFERSEPGAV
jgi:hypothetical protein